MSTVDLIDLGLFGIGGEKGSCENAGLVEDVEMYHSQELENLFSSHPNVENILDVSLQQSGIIAEETTVQSEKSMLVSFQTLYFEPILESMNNFKKRAMSRFNISCQKIYNLQKGAT